MAANAVQDTPQTTNGASQDGPRDAFDEDPTFEEVAQTTPYYAGQPSNSTSDQGGGGWSEGGWGTPTPAPTGLQKFLFTLVSFFTLIISGSAALTFSSVTLSTLVGGSALQLVFLLSLSASLLLLLHGWAWSLAKPKSSDDILNWGAAATQRPPLLTYARVIRGLGVLFALIGLVAIIVQLNIVQGLLLLTLAAAMASVFPLSYIAYDQIPRGLSTGGVASPRDQTTRQQTIQRLTLDFLLLMPGLEINKSVSGLPVDGAANAQSDSSDAWKVMRFCRERAENYYNRFNSVGEYVLHIILAMLATLIGLSFFVWTPPSGLVSEATLAAMRFGFLGAYLFAVQLVYRRYTTIDLQPSVYMYCAQTLLGGLVFNYVAFQALTLLVGTSEDIVAQGALGIIAFSLGYFPFIAIRWFSRITYNTLVLQRGRGEFLALEMIDGISDLHETRLREQGIDNVQNLACANLFELLTTTNFNSQQLADWVDQAMLYMYLEPQKIEVFRGASIRTASDFWKQWRSVQDKPNTDPARTSLIDKLQSTDAHLAGLYDATFEGPNVDEIKAYWARKPYEGKLAQMLWRMSQADNLERAANSMYDNFGTALFDKTSILQQRLYSWLQAHYQEMAGEAMLLPTIEDLQPPPAASGQNGSGKPPVSSAATKTTRHEVVP